jgi:hypothetical protein
MTADRVDRHELSAMLTKLARKLERKAAVRR